MLLVVPDVLAGQQHFESIVAQVTFSKIGRFGEHVVNASVKEHPVLQQPVVPLVVLLVVEVLEQTSLPQSTWQP